MMKKLMVFVILIALGLCFTGCSSTENEEKEDTENKTAEKTEKKQKISIDEFDWSVDEGVVDGERYVLLSYTNNSDYTIAGIEMTFEEKDDISDEDKEAYYSKLQEDFELDEEDMTDIKNRSISMRAEIDKIVEPGETSTNINCYYYSGYYYVKNIDHYNLVEPDILTIQYVEDEQIYTLYYDFHSDHYNLESETEEAYQWSLTDLGDKFPKPEVEVVEAGRNDEGTFRFDAYGMTLDEFNQYVEECRTMGYTVDSAMHEGFYSADNSEGYNIYLSYDEREHCMSGTFKAPTDE